MRHWMELRLGSDSIPPGPFRAELLNVERLEDRVAELSRGGIKDTLAALTLAALDITDELFRAREDRERQDGDVNTRLGALVEMLERLAPAPPRPGA